MENIALNKGRLLSPVLSVHPAQAAGGFSSAALCEAVGVHEKVLKLRCRSIESLKHQSLELSWNLIVSLPPAISPLLGYGDVTKKMAATLK
jgi:hypothetical protein